MAKLTVAKPVLTVILVVVAAVTRVADAAKDLVLRQLPSLCLKGVGSKILLPHFFVRFSIKIASIKTNNYECRQELLNLIKQMPDEQLSVLINNVTTEAQRTQR